MGIRARNMDLPSANRYVDFTFAGAMPTLTGTGVVTQIGVWPFGQRSPPFGGAAIQSQYQFSRIVDIIVSQSLAGVGGTSFTVNVLKNGVTVLSTLGVVTLASGANQSTDVKGELALPAGWTRMVLKTDSTILLKKGDNIEIQLVITGTYSTAAQIAIAVIVDPNPV